MEVNIKVKSPGLAFGNRVEKLAGISQLSIDPVLGSSQQSPGARVAIQQRVTSKIFVTFATDVTSTQREAIKFEYQANRRTSFDAIRDQNGGFSFETTFRKQWNLVPTSL